MKALTVDGELPVNTAPAAQTPGAAAPGPNANTEATLRHTPLHALHQELGARLVAFAGYSMPVQYPQGLMAEHLHTRKSAGLFDVSHMGQLLLRGPQAAQALESLIPMDVAGLGLHKQRYGLLLNARGGILDDFMFVNRGDDLFLIVNGACKQADLEHLRQRIGERCEITPLPDQALLALQGPLAATALERLLPDINALVFMNGQYFDWQGVLLYITRSGYTGEDGFEISVPAAHAEALARTLLAQPEVQPVGLGARNSLRLEAGLCLYGNDLNPNITPIEAGLNWAIQKARRSGGEREGAFPGSEIVLPQMEQPHLLHRKRIGLVAMERVPVREGVTLQNEFGEIVGTVTSGLLSPSLDKAIAMAYVPPAFATPGTRLDALVRGKIVPMQVTVMPFLAPNYHRG